MALQFNLALVKSNITLFSRFSLEICPGGGGSVGRPSPVRASSLDSSSSLPSQHSPVTAYKNLNTEHIAKLTSQGDSIWSITYLSIIENPNTESSQCIYKFYA